MRDFSELKCPKCESLDFNQDDTSNFDLDGSCDVRFECQECGCLWLVGLFHKYTDDEEIVED